MIFSSVRHVKKEKKTENLTVKMILVKKVKQQHLSHAKLRQTQRLQQSDRQAEPFSKRQNFRKPKQLNFCLFGLNQELLAETFLCY